MRASWTRDEVILGLDVMLSNNSKHLSMDSNAIIELSELLNRLPIIPISERNDTFRNPAGIRRQLLTFEWSLRKNDKASHVGEIFYTVYNEFNGNEAEIKCVAQAIRRNESLIRQIGFGATEENEGFPEGAILCHLHRYLEQQQSLRFLKDAVQCFVCGIQPEHIYGSLPNVKFFELHLLIPPTEISSDATFVQKDFITVCPNCHCILHQLRPWRNRKQCEDILQTL
ncbi:MAG: hypothetical protein ABFD18_06010 [Syntrophomonas sp.]